MRFKTISALLLIFFVACESKKTDAPVASVVSPLVGTWKLVSGTTIQGTDTVTTDYTKNKDFVKVINSTHFSFVGHDLTKGKDSIPFYSSGAGTYSLKDSLYTENLQFCNDRMWEGNSFPFTIKIENDSLIQTGVEKVEKINVNRLNVERYVRVK